MHIKTKRLSLHPAVDLDDLAALQEVFNSNPEFVAASEQGSGKCAYTQDDTGMYVWQESNRENTHCLAIYRNDTRELIGTIALQVPNPADGHPWIGLLVIGKPWQRQGLGEEVITAIERRLALEGRHEVWLNVMTPNEGARRFWDRCGYRVVQEDRDQDGRAVVMMVKRLSPPG